MKNTLKILGISLALFGCLSQNIELKPVKKVTDCLLKEAYFLAYSDPFNVTAKPSLEIQTSLFVYNENGNPSSWTVVDEKGGIIWQIKLEYENNKLKQVKRYEYCKNSKKIEMNAIKTYEIKDDFSEMIVSQTYVDSCQNFFEASAPQKLKFSRFASSQNELKFIESFYLDIEDKTKIIEKAALYEYDFEKNNILKKHDYKYGIVEEAKGFLKNIRSPFNTNIWFSLIINYREDWELEGGDWSRNVQSIEPESNIISTYQTNSEGFPCVINAKNLDFTPFPIEGRYYYYNCDCK